MGYVKLPANLADILVLVLERKRSSPGEHLKTVNVRERIDDLLSYPITEIFLFCRAQIQKRQDRDRIPNILLQRTVQQKGTGHEQNSETEPSEE